MLEVRLTGAISHSVAGSALTIEEWWLVVHYEFQKDLDHMLLNEVDSHLEMRLGKVFEQDEELVEVSPVNSSTIHHSFNEELDQPQSCRLLASLLLDFKHVNGLAVDIKVKLLLHFSKVPFLILYCDGKRCGEEIGEDLSNFGEVAAQQHFLKDILLLRNPLHEPDTRDSV